MKKIIFILATVLFSIGLINATETTIDNSYYTYKKGESFNFIQDAIHFQVFQNGEFDFFIEPENFAAANYNHNDISITFNSGYDYEAYVQYDDYGAIIQIENTPIYYDYYGRISNIGDTHIRYNNRRLVQFGSMYVNYNRYGYFDHYTGYINYYNRHHYYRPYFSFYVRPVFNYCVVSYNPYRRHYAPVRYRYNSYDYRRTARTRRSHIANNTYSRRSISRKVEVATRPTRRSVASQNSRNNVRKDRVTTRKNDTKITTRNTTSRTNSSRKVSNRKTVSSNSSNRSVSKPNVRSSKSVSTTNRKTVSNKRGSSVSSNRKSVSSRKSSTVNRKPTVRKSKKVATRKVTQSRSSQKRKTSSRRRRS